MTYFKYSNKKRSFNEKRKGREAICMQVTMAVQKRNGQGQEIKGVNE